MERLQVFLVARSLPQLRGGHRDQPLTAATALVCLPFALLALLPPLTLPRPPTPDPAGKMSCCLVSDSSSASGPQGVTAEIPSPPWNLLPPPGGDTGGRRRRVRAAEDATAVAAPNTGQSVSLAFADAEIGRIKNAIKGKGERKDWQGPEQLFYMQIGFRFRAVVESVLLGAVTNLSLFWRARRGSE